MRWFSSFALLVYLSLLCTPQALAVHDSRLSPLADSQLQALNPALHAALFQKRFTPDPHNDDPDNNDPHNDDPHNNIELPFGLISASSWRCPGAALSLLPVVECYILTVVSSGHPARAPPILSSL